MGQIGVLPVSGTDLHAITRDTNRYATLTITSDGKSLATVQTKTTRNIYVLPGSGSESAQVDALLTEVRDAHEGINWTSDGKLMASDGAGLWKLDPDGKNASQLLGDATANLYQPTPCGSRYTVFGWAFHAGNNFANIWRVNSDGSNPVQLTSGKFDLYPVCSPDQKWVYYLDSPANVIKRVATGGSSKSEAVDKSDNFRGYVEAVEMGISADGKTLAYLIQTVDAQTQEGTQRIAMLKLEPPGSLRQLDVDPRVSGGVQFTPDGKAVAYPVRENGVDNIWIQPLDGSAGHSITHFKSDLIGGFYWSADGKMLDLLRLHSDSDVVLVQETSQ